MATAPPARPARLKGAPTKRRMKRKPSRKV